MEDCGGAGGNVCFSVNGAVDPVPGVTDTFSLFDQDGNSRSSAVNEVKSDAPTPPPDAPESIPPPPTSAPGGAPGQ